MRRQPWAATFLDSFRYVDQLARLAKQGVKVVFHNTLAACECGLLDQNTFTPRPNYWAALLWRRLMGTTVLNPGSSPTANLHLYAHCLRDRPGGVALLAINTDQRVAHDIALPTQADRYTLTAKQLLDTTVQLNGSKMQIGSDGAVPQLVGVPVRPGRVRFAPMSITFLAIPHTGNSSCQ